MNKILEKKKLADKVWSFRVAAPLIARRRKAGQFVILRLWEGGERIPLTIADADPLAGSITLIAQEVGKSTSLLAHLQPGDHILDLVGPLGRPTHIDHFGTVVLVGGGIGIAPAHPIARAMKEAGNRVVSILGARCRELLILEQEMREASHAVRIVTDDGSYGTQGLVTDALRQLIEDGERVDLVIAIGPPIMMRSVSEFTRPYGIKTMVSLNSIMIDGTGMCGGCRVRCGGENRFVCVDGPEFDGHKVDFGNMMARLRAYADREREAMQLWEQPDHKFGEPGCTYFGAISRATRETKSRDGVNNDEAA